MDLSIWIALAALLLQFFVMLIGAVWIVAQIKSTTDTLNNSIALLSRSIDKLETAYGQHEKQQAEHETRLQLLERPLRN
jgi:predicted PurR-regulated permease PerM